jgi:hypothetical protein
LNGVISNALGERALLTNIVHCVILSAIILCLYIGLLFLFRNRIKCLKKEADTVE